MFKEMRRSDRALGEEEILKILDEGLYGILSTSGTDGYAYGVPLSYARQGNTIYMHAAMEGQKLAAIAQNDRVSFCVVGKVATLPEKFSTKYESVIVIGRASILTESEKEPALLALINKYSADYLEQGKAYIDKAKGKTTVIKLAVEHSSGKARR
ncbi:MAG: pyridoxamine 5'-phosphate oxidase family protein [Pelosinus sp.]|nr:pyridoxamine 5'-phosphate oxidase family protein [Pelosinus sp.]